MLEFERPIIELQDRIEGLKTLPSSSNLKIQDEIMRLEKKATRLLSDMYQKLTPWQKVQVARHPERPKSCDYIERLITNFTLLSGDRCFSDDLAITAGIGLFRKIPVMILGHEKGKDTDTRLKHNFGMAHPEGYRKAMRAMKIADNLGLPVLCFVDTPGAYAGIQAEERGQSQAIAECIEVSLQVQTPILSVIIGEGGSGGAVALATANSVSMLEHSVYSVISPEGCSAILWKTRDKREEAAVAQKLTAQDLLALKTIDHIIPEPLGGAQRNQTATIDYVADALYAQMHGMQNMRDFAHHRRQRFLNIGQSYLSL